MKVNAYAIHFTYQNNKTTLKLILNYYHISISWAITRTNFLLNHIVLHSFFQNLVNITLFCYQ